MARKKCRKCGGTGERRCPKCHGSNRFCPVCSSSLSFLGAIGGTVRCESCNGTGYHEYTEKSSKGSGKSSTYSTSYSSSYTPTSEGDGSGAAIGLLVIIGVLFALWFFFQTKIEKHTYQQPITSNTTPSSWNELIMQNPQYFSNLPVGVKAKLTELKCLIPKSLNGSNNVISGHFWSSNEISWAVVCSREAQSSIIVFNDNIGNKYSELGQWNEDHWLVTDHNKSFYRREISSVDKSFIIEHYQNHGGPAPPKIKHEAINDGYLEMSSTVYYFNGNQWLQLTGAD